LLIGAEKAFFEHGYTKTSVAEICREANVANGTFYQYFSDKFDVFSNIVHALRDDLLQRLHQTVSQQRDVTAQLTEANKVFFTVVAERASAYQIFRESEFVNLELAQSFYGPVIKFYTRIIQSGIQAGELLSLFPEASAWGILGLQEFVATRWLIWERPQTHAHLKLQLDDLINTPKPFILFGLDCPFKLYRGEYKIPPQSSDGEGSSSTRKALLEAAEQWFGKQGFYAASISDVTREVGVAQGTFYLYFPSKVAIFAQLVREINRNLIDAIRKATAGLAHRRDVEQVGFMAFFQFIRQHHLAYRIVREAEFVDEEAGQGYYRRIAAGYVKGLGDAIKQGQIHNYKPEQLAYCLMGIGHYAGLKWLVWEDLDALPENVHTELMRFACEGVLIDSPA